MGLETGTFIDDLVQTNPLGADPKAQGDDHIRLLKKVIQNTLLNADKAYDLSAMEIAGILNSDKPNPNLIMNGDFGISQRGDIQTGINDLEYSADRWILHLSGSSCDFDKILDPLSAPNNGGGQFFARYTPQGGNTNLAVATRLESAVTNPHENIQLTMAISIRTSIAHAFQVSVSTADVPDDFTNVTQRFISSSQPTAVNTWQRFDYTFSVPAGMKNGAEISIELGASDGVLVDLATAQLEVGSQATRYEFRSLQNQIQDCFRYFEAQPYPTASPNASVIAVGQAVSVSEARAPHLYTIKRVVPLITVPTGTLRALNSAGGDSGATITHLIPTIFGAVFLASGGTGLVAGDAALFSSDGAAEIFIDAEL